MSEHFKEEEFACKCGCGFNAVDPRLIQALEDLRGIIKKPIHVNSGCRCQKHNAAIGGEKNSQHLLGRAADITIKGMSSHAVYLCVIQIPAFQQGGIGLYDSWVHVDVRRDGRPHQWNRLSANAKGKRKKT